MDKPYVNFIPGTGPGFTPEDNQYYLNSNSVAHAFLENCGIPVVKPGVFLPGWDNFTFITP